MNVKTVSKGENTKQQLIEVGARLFHQQGYHNTGLQQILQQASITKGSFYFHFNDKEAFALAIIDLHIDNFKECLSQHLTKNSLTAMQKIEAFHLFFLDMFSQKEFKGGCPIGNFCQEMADISAAFADKLNVALNAMIRCISKVLDEGKSDGTFDPRLDSIETAGFIIDSWEGAVLRMKATQSPAPLENWYRFTKQILLSKEAKKA